MARWWEQMREGARAAGVGELPAPWLALNRKPIIEGKTPIAPFRLVQRDYTHDPDLGDVIVPCAINLCYSDEQIIGEFAANLRKIREAAGKTDRRGRKDGDIAQLWDLAVYRLSTIERLSHSQIRDALERTAYRTRRSKSYGEGVLRDISSAISRARGIVQRNAVIFTKDDRQLKLMGWLLEFQ